MNFSAFSSQDLGIKQGYLSRVKPGQVKPEFDQHLLLKFLLDPKIPQDNFFLTFSGPLIFFQLSIMALGYVNSFKYSIKLLSLHIQTQLNELSRITKKGSV